MFRKHFDLCLRFVLGLDFEDFTVARVSRSIHTVDLLYGFLLAIDNMIGFFVLRPGLGNDLEIKDVGTTIDGIFDRNSFCEVIHESLFDNNHCIVNSPRPFYRDTII